MPKRLFSQLGLQLLLNRAIYLFLWEREDNDDLENRRHRPKSDRVEIVVAIVPLLCGIVLTSGHSMYQYASYKWLVWLTLNLGFANVNQFWGCIFILLGTWQTGSMLLSKNYPEGSKRCRKIGLIVAGGFWAAFAIFLLFSGSGGIGWVFSVGQAISNGRWHTRLENEIEFEKEYLELAQENRQLRASTEFAGQLISRRHLEHAVGGTVEDESESTMGVTNSNAVGNEADCATDGEG